MRERGPPRTGGRGWRGRQAARGDVGVRDTYLIQSLWHRLVRSRGNVSEPTDNLVAQHQADQDDDDEGTMLRFVSSFSMVNRLKAYPPGMYLTPRDRIQSQYKSRCYSLSLSLFLSFLDSHSPRLSSFAPSRGRPRFNWNLSSTSVRVFSRFDTRCLAVNFKERLFSE